MAQENIKLSPEIEQLSEKLSADPKSRIFAQLADAYRKAGLLDEAIDTAKKGLEHHPNYAVAHLILGRCYLAKGMYALAREEFELTIKQDPQNLVGYKLLGETYEKQNMYPEALKYYQMILDLEPADAELAQKISDLKSFKQPEPEPEPTAQPETVPEITQPADDLPEPAAPAAEPEAASATQEAAAIPEVLQEAEGTTSLPSLPEEISLPPVLAEGPEAAVAAEPVAGMAPAPEGLMPETPGERSAETVPPPDAAAPAGSGENKAEAEPQGPTSTLAEIYVQQGFLDKAIDIYKELVSAQPDNQEYKDRMDELLTKAYPEEAPALAEPAVPPEPPAQGPSEMPGTAVSPDLPPAPEGKREEAQADTVPAEDPFAKLFGQPTVNEIPPAPETPAIAPSLETIPEPAPAPAAEVKLPEPPAESPAVDFGALFSDATPVQPQVTAPAAEPEPPAAQAKPAGSSGPGEGEDAVSSFQSWLSQIQK